MIENSFYFYDLETSGTDPRNDRIMQFAGQRTDLDLNPIGEPDNILIKMTDDILPEPAAILVTGITPQKTLEEGISEREFAKYFVKKVATKGTIITGFNSIRFDNEFIRYLMYRNFFDAYEWSYLEDVSAWDILDLVRITRALRPAGINWPFASDGSPANKLELLTAVNKINHIDAHDALSDVNATIAIAKLIKTKQPKIFDYILNMRDKQSVARMVESGQPFVYTSGRYDSESLKTTVAVMISEHPVYGNSRALVYDLNKDPSEFLTLNLAELIERLQYKKSTNGNNQIRLPVKEIVYNKCPAVAPINVLNETALNNTGLNIDKIQKNLKTLKKDPTFIDRIVEAVEKAIAQKQQSFIIDTEDVDSRLYDGFFSGHDKKLMALVRSKDPDKLADYHPNFSDDRLTKLLLLYKARQLPQSLSQDEQSQWQKYRWQKLMAGGKDSRISKYGENIQSMMQSAKSEREKNLLQDLWLWAESIAPAGEDY